MKYLLLMLIVACKLQPFSSPQEGDLIVPNTPYHGVNFYLQIEEGVVLAKENDQRAVYLKIHNMKLRQPKNSYAVNDSAELLDGIDNVIIDSYQGTPRLFYLDEIKFSLTPNAAEPYIYTCTFSNVVLGKFKFQLGANKPPAANTANGCTSNHDKIAHEKLIVENCGAYAQTNAIASRDQLRYQSSDINAGKLFNEGDVYIFKNTQIINGRTCEQHVIFDYAAAQYVKAQALTCKNRNIKTPHMGESFLSYNCKAVDVIFLSGQADNNLKVVAKYKFARTSDKTNAVQEGSLVYRDEQQSDNNDARTNSQPNTAQEGSLVYKDSNTYFDGIVATIKSDGTFNANENKMVRITLAP